MAKYIDVRNIPAPANVKEWGYYHIYHENGKPVYRKAGQFMPYADAIEYAAKGYIVQVFK